MTQKPTIEDIARLAEVSRGTVSRVLNNHPAVSDDTRARVLDVIERLNYSPNYSARHMRTETSKMVGFETDEEGKLGHGVILPMNGWLHEGVRRVSLAGDVHEWQEGQH